MKIVAAMRKCSAWALSQTLHSKTGHLNGIYILPSHVMAASSWILLYPSHIVASESSSIARLRCWPIPGAMNFVDPNHSLCSHCSLRQCHATSITNL